MITGRDIELMRWINRQGMVTAYQVAEKFEIGIKKIHMRLGMMKAEKLVNHQKILFGQPGVYWLTTDGVSVCESDLKPIKGLTISTLQHDLQVVSLAIKLEQQYGGKWVTAREIIAKQTYQTMNALQQLKVIKQCYPDGILEMPNGLIAVELELTQKAASRVRKIINEYAHLIISGQYVGVWYVCRNRQIGEHMLLTAGTTAMGGKFRAFLKEDLSEIQDISVRESAEKNQRTQTEFDFTKF